MSSDSDGDALRQMAVEAPISGDHPVHMDRLDGSRSRVDVCVAMRERRQGQHVKPKKNRFKGAKETMGHVQC